MGGTFAEAKRRVLERRLAAIVEDYTKTSGQLERTISEPDRSRLERQLRTLDEEASYVEAELNELSRASIPHTIDDGAFQAHIPRIDFGDTRKIIENSIKKSGDTGYASVVAIQHSLTFGGQWFIAGLRDDLRRLTRDFRHWQIELKLEGDEHTLLQALGQYLNIQPQSTDMEQFEADVVRTLCSSIRSGTTIFIEIRNCEYLIPHDRVFHWFFAKIWDPIVDELPSLAEQWRNFRVLVVFTSNAALPAVVTASPRRCSVSGFANGGLLHLRLRRWRLAEIRTWLSIYSPLNVQEIDTLSRHAFYASQRGIPNLVYDLLRQQLTE